MAGGNERHPDAIDRNRIAVTNGLRYSGKIFAIPRAHDGERFGGREHRAMPGARMIGMTVRDDGARDGRGRIDVKIARGTVKALRTAAEDFVKGGHAQDIIMIRPLRSVLQAQWPRIAQ